MNGAFSYNGLLEDDQLPGSYLSSFYDTKPTEAGCFGEATCCEQPGCSNVSDCVSACDGFVDCDNSPPCTDPECEDVRQCRDSAPPCFDEKCYLALQQASLGPSCAPQDSHWHGNSGEGSTQNWVSRQQQHQNDQQAYNSPFAFGATTDTYQHHTNAYAPPPLNSKDTTLQTQEAATVSGTAHESFGFPAGFGPPAPPLSFERGNSGFHATNDNGYEHGTSEFDFSALDLDFMPQQKRRRTSVNPRPGPSSQHSHQPTAGGLWQQTFDTTQHPLESRPAEHATSWKPIQSNGFDFFHSHTLDPIPCQWSHCEDTVDPSSILNHVKRKHTDETQQYVCYWAGCLCRFSTPEKLHEHLMISHIEQMKEDVMAGKGPVSQIQAEKMDSKRPVSRSRSTPLSQPSIHTRSTHPSPPTPATDAEVGSSSCHWNSVDASGHQTTCDYKCDTELDLHNHVKDAHLKPLNMHTKYRCFWQGCNRHGASFSQRAKLERHICSHTGFKEFKCPICNNEFPTLTALQQHERTHTGEKPYVCETCGKRFAHSTALTTHR